MKLASQPLHPLLTALALPLPLYVANRDAAGATELVGAMVALICLALVLWALLFAALRDLRRAALGASVSLIAIFAFSSLRDLWPDAEAGAPRMAPLLFAIYGLAGLGALVLATRVRAGIDRWTRLANLSASAALAVPLLGLAPSLFEEAPRTIPPAPELELAGVGKRPSIYYIVLDGYGRADRLDEYFGFDNTPFLAALRERGFHVDERAFANYAHTYLSLASSLNFDYVQRLQHDYAATAITQGVLADWILAARVPALLRKLGYRSVAFPSPFKPTSWSDADLFLATRWTTSEFQDALVARTVLPALVDALGLESAYDYHRFRVRNVLDNLGSLPARFEAGDEGTPLFVFGHVLAPHPPFAFAADGSPVDPPRPLVFWDGDEYYAEGGTREEYLRGYPAQLRFVNERLLAAIDEILATSTQPPVIILQGDHGSGLGLSHTDAAATDVRERFPALLALHAPGVPDAQLPHGRSPVNLFRLLLRELFGARLPPLEDRAYNSVWTAPDRFVDVTQAIGAGKPAH